MRKYLSTFSRKRVLTHGLKETYNASLSRTLQIVYCCIVLHTNRNLGINLQLVRPLHLPRV